MEVIKICDSFVTGVCSSQNFNDNLIITTIIAHQKLIEHQLLNSIKLTFNCERM